MVAARVIAAASVLALRMGRFGEEHDLKRIGEPRTCESSTTVVSPHSPAASSALKRDLSHEMEKRRLAREFAELSSINPCLLLPVFIDGDMQLRGSNLIIEYLLKTYPDIPTVSPKTAAGDSPDHH